MLVSDYFIPGKMYQYVGIPSYFFSISSKHYYARPRRWLCVEGLIGQAGQCYPEVGDYFMCLKVDRYSLKINFKNGEADSNIIKFLTPDSKIVLDNARSMKSITVQKSKIAEQHLSGL